MLLFLHLHSSQSNWDKVGHRLMVKVAFADGNEPQGRSLWGSVECIGFPALPKTGAATYEGEVILSVEVKTLNVSTVHAQEENGATRTISSPEIRVE